MHQKTVVSLLLLSIMICCIESQLLETLVDNTSNSASDNNELETARKRKKGGKYTVPLLIGALMIKSVIFPLAFKVMAVMSSVAVLLSTMSLIVSSIVGYLKVAIKPKTAVKIVHKHPYSWAKDDEDSFSNYYTIQPVDYNPQAPPPGGPNPFNKYT